MIRSHRYFYWALCALMLIAFTLNSLFAGDQPKTTPPDWDPELGPPIGPTEWEKAHEHEFPVIIGTDDPPPAPVVNPAEWEPMTGVLIRYPLGISTEIVREMAEDVEVMTIVSGSSQQQQAYNQYAAAGVNMDNCTWLIAPSNSMWTRDYGPWFTFIGTDVQGISNHTYNRPTRPDDNNIPRVFGQTFNIPVYDLPLVHTGGNYMSDGMGVSMSTNLVYNENPSLTQAQIDDIMWDYLGVYNYDVVPDILSSGIHHIDCWAKMLDPGRILAKRLSPPNATLEANVAYWESQISSYGRPYEVIRVDCYSSTPYTNSLILDNKVLVPLFGGALDAQAMQTYQNAMPGYEILGYTGSWVSDDAIHCRTMGITDRYMLRIVHVPLSDQENNGEDYPLEVTIHPYSNLPLCPGSPEILWKPEGGSYSSAPLTYQGDDLYTGAIPQQPDLTTVYYYIHAEDESGRRENHPYIGAGNPHHFFVAPDTTAPEIVHYPLSDLSVYEWPPIITAVVTDNIGIAEVYVQYSINDLAQPTVYLTPVGDTYSGQLSGSVIVGDVYEYHIVAVDASVAGNIAYCPETGMYGGSIVSAYYANMEDGAPGWSHTIVNPGFNDQWHLSTQQNHTTGGTQSWKCGDTGFGNYANLLDAGLVTEEYAVTNGCRLSFWHIMSAEISSSYPGYAYDGGMVEMSVDGGGWTQITPVGGYPYLVRVGSSPGPFPAETPIFSGFTDSWEQVSFELPGIAGDVRFRFRFGSDGSAAEEGWFVDDALIVLTGSSTPEFVVEVNYISGSPVPQGGGNLYYGLYVSNNSGQVQDFDGWVDMVYEGGPPNTVVMRSFTNYQPGWTINRPNVYFPVPGSWAGGNYELYARVGQHPDVIWQEDSFNWSKSGIVDLAFDPGAFMPSGGFPNPFETIITDAGSITAPSEFVLHGANPNPFNPITVLSYSLPKAERVELAVYDVAGRLVATLVNGWRAAGNHEAPFDASGLSSGVYIYHLTSGAFTASGKMMLIK